MDMKVEKNALFCYTWLSYKLIYAMNYSFLQKISAYFKEIWFLWLLGIIFNIITFFAVRYKIRPSDETLALHYNVLIGVDWFGSGNNLYLIPLTGLIILAVNFSAFYFLKESENLLSFLTAFVSLVVQIILLSSIFLLAGVN